MSKVDDLIRAAESELGYLEKSEAAYRKYGPSCLQPKTEYAGADNYTKFAPEAGHPNGEPWCQTFVAALMIRVFGREEANRLLCGKVSSASTMDVKQAMCDNGRRVPIGEARPGDLAYRSRSGGGHVGLVTGWHDGEIITIEGNSSSSDIMAWNGGAVVKHIGAPWMWIVRPEYDATGWRWIYVDGTWFYQDAKGRNSYGWKLIQETGGEARHWYHFDSAGRMQTGLIEDDGKRYYLTEDGPLAGACCITDTSGALSPWYV